MTLDEARRTWIAEKTKHLVEMAVSIGTGYELVCNTKEYNELDAEAAQLANEFATLIDAAFATQPWGGEGKSGESH